MQNSSDTRRRATPSVARKGGPPVSVRIDCPFPLIVAGLAKAAEEARLRPHQRPGEPGAPHIVVLWADDAEKLAGDVECVRKDDPEASILVLGLRKNLPLASAAVRAGARGYVHAEMTPKQIARALLVAARGEMAAPRELLEYLVSDASGDEPSGEYGNLKPRQREILRLLAKGLTNAQIADRLYLSESTVKGHLRVAYKILGVRNRTEAAKAVRDANAYGRRADGLVAGS